MDRPTGGERAVLVHIDFPADKMQEDLLEFKELAESAGALPVEIITGSREAPDPKYFVGTGKADEICACVKTHNAELVIVNHALSPGQERNLEKLFHCRVVDRIGLILDIFAQRARSFEGKLQVELALLKHLSSRLVRGWTHLERQRGGIGLRGPGETQLETDRRLIRTRIKFITNRLTRVRTQREQSRRARQRAEILTVALVGYTNAGKSTLFNRLTGADVYAAHRLFATLDPTLRRVELSEIGPIVLADTVGFIRHLPHELVNAFHATLEEVTRADLLLHVIDAFDENKESAITEVDRVLETIGGSNVPKILVYNKIDLCEGMHPGMDDDADDRVMRVRVSAQNSLGIDELNQAITKALSKDIVQQQIVLSPTKAKLRAELYQLAAVLSEEIDDEGCFHLSLRLSRAEWQRMMSKLVES